MVYRCPRLQAQGFHGYRASLLELTGLGRAKYIVPSCVTFPTSPNPNPETLNPEPYVTLNPLTLDPRA